MNSISKVSLVSVCMTLVASLACAGDVSPSSSLAYASENHLSLAKCYQMDFELIQKKRDLLQSAQYKKWMAQGAGYGFCAAAMACSAWYWWKYLHNTYAAEPAHAFTSDDLARVQLVASKLDAITSKTKPFYVRALRWMGKQCGYILCSELAMVGVRSVAQWYQGLSMALETDKQMYFGLIDQCFDLARGAYLAKKDRADGDDSAFGEEREAEQYLYVLKDASEWIYARMIFRKNTYAESFKNAYNQFMVQLEQPLSRHAIISSAGLKQFAYLS